MWDFDADEIAFFLAAGIAGLFLVGLFYRSVLVVDRMVSPVGPRLFFSIIPIGCALMVFWVLANWSDQKTVRGHADYMALFMAGGVVWIMAAVLVAPLFGVHLRDDVVERKNTAAAVALSGAMIGNALCYAGANIGQGPTIWTTILPALLASAALAISLTILLAFTDFGEILTIERSVRSALVLAGFFVLAGADFGWAASGDWDSWTGTVVDFLHRSWPGFVLLVMTIILLRVQKPRIAFTGVK